MQKLNGIVCVVAMVVLAFVLTTTTIDVRVNNPLGPDRVVRRPLLRWVWSCVKTSAFVAPLFFDEEQRLHNGSHQVYAPQVSSPRAIGSDGYAAIDNGEGW